MGTLFIALADDSGAEPTVEEYFFPTDREAFKQRASQARAGFAPKEDRLTHRFYSCTVTTVPTLTRS